MSSKEVEILLVEDSPADAKMTRRAFDRSKIVSNLSIVIDGEQALDFLNKKNGYAEANRPDLILLDLNLPKIDGRELLKIIKEEEKFRTIPVIILTTSRSEDDILKTYQLHANSFVTKPANLDSLIEIFKSIDAFWFKVVTLPSDQG